MTEQLTSREAGGDFEPTERSKVRRKADRGHYDRATVFAILDQSLICHVGIVSDGAPVVLPTTFARVDDVLYLHGARANHLLRSVAAGRPACIETTIVDAIVFARSAFHHSMNYRSVVLHGVGAEVTDDDEKRAALDAVVERMAPGRGDHSRRATQQELRATLVIRFPIAEAAAKVRDGDPIDDPADLELDIWAGILPLTVTAGELVPDALMGPSVTAPAPVPSWGRSVSR